jgi:hypothetical protein
MSRDFLNPAVCSAPTAAKARFLFSPARPQAMIRPAPTHFVSCVTIHLQQPAGRNVTKKIHKVPDRRKGDVKNFVLGIQVPTDDEGREQIEVEMRIQIDVLRNNTQEELGISVIESLVFSIICLSPFLAIMIFPAHSVPEVLGRLQVSWVNVSWQGLDLTAVWFDLGSQTDAILHINWILFRVLILHWALYRIRYWILCRIRYSILLVPVIGYC